MINQLVMSARSPLSGAPIFHTYPLSRPCPVSLIFRKPPTGFFAGFYIIASHKRAAVLYCSCHMQDARRYFNNGEKRVKFNIFFRVLCENQRVFAGN